MNYFQTTLISSLEYVRDQLEKHDHELQNRKRIFALPVADDQIQEKAQDRPLIVNQMVEKVLQDDGEIKSTGSSDNLNNKLDVGSNIEGKAEIIQYGKISPEY